MPLDSLITSAGRLRILTALATEPKMEFVPLRRTTRLTDGNLSAHAKRLNAGGLLAIDKEFRAGKPVTSYRLTQEGRAALERHVNSLVAAIASVGATTEAIAPEHEPEDEWVD